MRFTTSIALAGLLMLQGTPALAARPFVTDDARLTTAGSCQLESWSRLYADSHELWALPACNPQGNLELTLGGGRAHHEGAAGTSDYVAQLKTLFRPLDTNGWGWGLALGTIRHPQVNPGPNLLGNTYAYIPTSFSLLDDRIVLYANLGWLHDKASRRDSSTWGLGAEFGLAPQLLGIAETYGDNHGTSYGQLGIRISVLPELFQIDATLGQQMSGSGSSRWISFGIRYTPDKLF